MGGGLLTAGYPLVRALSQSRNVKKERAFIPTPGNTLGPFYRRGAPRRQKLSDANSSGVPLLLVAGRVINTEGAALAGAILEVFHADICRAPATSSSGTPEEFASESFCLRGAPRL